MCEVTLADAAVSGEIESAGADLSAEAVPETTETGRDAITAEAPSRESARSVKLAWSVHIYTALGVVSGLMALVAAGRDEYRIAFIWLCVSLFIDCTDGIMARRTDVKRWVPEFDGRRLDDIVDFINYAFVPVYIAWRIPLVPAGWEVLLAAPLLASGFGFCQSDAKTSDGFFMGFPSYWNVLVMYLYMLQWPPALNAVTILIFTGLVFVPIRYLYPSQSPWLRAFSIGATFVWGLFFLYLVALQADAPHPALLYGTLAYPLFYLGISVVMDAWVRRGARR